MVFASLTFIFLVLPLFWTLDFIFKKKIFLRNFALCAVSLFFYVFGGGTHCLKILIAYGVLNYIFGLILERQKSSTSSKKELYQKLLLIWLYTHLLKRLMHLKPHLSLLQKLSHHLLLQLDLHIHHIYAFRPFLITLSLI